MFPHSAFVNQIYNPQRNSTTGCAVTLHTVVQRTVRVRVSVGTYRTDQVESLQAWRPLGDIEPELMFVHPKILSYILPQYR